MSASGALRVGGLAAEMLGQRGFTARVLASGSRAVYFEDRAGRVLWLSPPGTALHRRCVLVPLDPASWHEGDRVYSDGDLLCSDGGHAIRWAGAAVWNAAPPEGRTVAAGLAAAALAQGIVPLGPPRGMAKPTFAILGGDKDSVNAAQHLADGWAQEASRHFAEVVAALEARDSAALLAASRPLVGLGEGLTPSGDDFVGGMLFGLRRAERRGRSAVWVDWAAVEDWLGGIASRTNKISHAILCDLAAGHGPEPFHALVDKTLAGGAREVVTWHAARVVRIGHTSGWDMLAGFAAALRGSLRQERRRDEASRRAARSLGGTAAFDRSGIPAGGIHGN